MRSLLSDTSVHNSFSATSRFKSQRSGKLAGGTFLDIMFYRELYWYAYSYIKKVHYDDCRRMLDVGIRNLNKNLLSYQVNTIMSNTSKSTFLPTLILCP